MNLRQLEIFVKVVDEGGFTQAARKLNMAQPAVSIAVRKLEEQVGLQLVYRSDKIHPTAEGEVLLKHAHKLLADMRLTKEAMQDLHQLASGVVRLSTTAIFGNYFFPQQINKFKAEYPAIKFQVYNQTTLNSDRLLNQHQCDLMIVDMDNLPKDIETTFISKQEVVVCNSVDHPLKKRKSITVEELLQYPLVLYRQGHRLRNIVNEQIRKYQVTPEILMESDLNGMILKTISGGQGVGVCLRAIIESEKSLKITPFKKPIYFNLGIGWKKGAYLSNANRAFIEFLKKSHA